MPSPDAWVGQVTAAGLQEAAAKDLANMWVTRQSDLWCVIAFTYFIILVAGHGGRGESGCPCMLHKCCPTGHVEYYLCRSIYHEKVGMTSRRPLEETRAVYPHVLVSSHLHAHPSQLNLERCGSSLAYHEGLSHVLGNTNAS